MGPHLNPGSKLVSNFIYHYLIKRCCCSFNVWIFTNVDNHQLAMVQLWYRLSLLLNLPADELQACPGLRLAGPV